MDHLNENSTFETSEILENTTEIVSLLKKISPRCHDYLLKCVWGSKMVNCTDVGIILISNLSRYFNTITKLLFFLQIFTVSTTDIGFCCSFNMIPPLESLSDVGWEIFMFFKDFDQIWVCQIPFFKTDVQCS